MIPPALSLLLSRRALAAGVGMTTREDKVLPPAEALPEIPERSGVGKPIVKRIQSVLRGWYAHVVGALRSACFAHDTLAVRDAGAEVYGHTYTVMPFATHYNVPGDDVSKLNDVLSFKDGAVLVNGIALPLLGISGGAPSGALPWLIPHPTPIGDLGKYGDSVTNTSVKRVFAVGRTRVHAWANGGVDADLGGAAYRPDKALACGARIDRSAHQAWLEQLHYTGSSWDALAGSWAITTAQVSMLLTSPYLQSVDSTIAVERSRAIPESQGSSSGSTVTSEAFPEVDICAVGVGEARTVSGQYLQVWFPWRYAHSYSVTGKRTGASSVSRWKVDVLDSTTIAGASVAVSAKNTLELASVTETLGYNAFSVDLPPVGGTALGTDNGTYSVSAHTVSWQGDAAQAAGQQLTPRGNDAYSRSAATLSGSATYATRSQSGEYHVTLGAHELVKIVFSHATESGQALSANAVAGRYDNALASPYAWIGTTLGFGTTSRVQLRLQPNGYLADETVLAPYLVDRANAKYVGGLCFDMWDSESSIALYTTSSTTRAAKDDRTLHAETRDFVLYDAAEQAYIYVLAEFSAQSSASASTVATLVVKVVVESRLGAVQQTIFSESITLPEVLPATPLTSSVNYIPLPRSSTFFTPKYREQGDFRGVAYTTADEEAAGAVPAFLVNFVMRLDTYAAIGSDEPTDVVSIVPCNLLEMLYAYVYSGKYGIDTSNRYPVDYSANFTLLNNQLFGVQHRVVHRNGANSDWLDALGGAYVTEQTTELYRV